MQVECMSSLFELLVKFSQEEDLLSYFSHQVVESFKYLDRNILKITLVSKAYIFFVSLQEAKGFGGCGRAWYTYPMR